MVSCCWPEFSKKGRALAADLPKAGLSFQAVMLSALKEDAGFHLIYLTAETRAAVSLLWDLGKALRNHHTGIYKRQ